MKTIYAFIFCMFFLRTFIYAQAGYLEGFIVKINGDTVKGYLDDRTDMNSKTIYFKLALAESAVKYEAEDLKMYYLSTGKYYVTKTILLADKYESTIKKKAFLETLEQGKAVLYYIRTNFEGERFYIEKDTVFLELTNDRKIINKDGTDLIFYNKKYINILNALFSDCTNWNSKSEYKFEEYELKKAVRKYNACFINNDNKEAQSNELKKEKIKTSYIVSAGTNLTTVQELSYGHERLMLNPEIKVLPHLGFAMNLFFPRTNKKMSVQIGINYNQKGATCNTVVAPSLISSYNFDLHYLDFDLLAKYTFSKKKIQPFIGGGLVFGYLLNNNSAFTYNFKGQTRKIYDFLGDENKFQSPFEFGGCIEGGVFIPFKHKQTGLMFMCRYEYTHMITTVVSYNYNNQVLQFKIGYRFK